MNIIKTLIAGTILTLYSALSMQVLAQNNSNNTLTQTDKQNISKYYSKHKGTREHAIVYFPKKEKIFDVTEKSMIYSCKLKTDKLKRLCGNKPMYIIHNHTLNKNTYVDDVMPREIDAVLALDEITIQNRLLASAPSPGDTITKSGDISVMLSLYKYAASKNSSTNIRFFIFSDNSSDSAQIIEFGLADNVKNVYTQMAYNKTLADNNFKRLCDFASDNPLVAESIIPSLDSAATEANNTSNLEEKTYNAIVAYYNIKHKLYVQSSPGLCFDGGDKEININGFSELFNTDKFMFIKDHGYVKMFKEEYPKSKY